MELLYEGGYKVYAYTTEKHEIPHFHTSAVIGAGYIHGDLPGGCFDGERSACFFLWHTTENCPHGCNDSIHNTNVTRAKAKSPALTYCCDLLY